MFRRPEHLHDAREREFFITGVPGSARTVTIESPPTMGIDVRAWDLAAHAFTDLIQTLRGDPAVETATAFADCVDDRVA